MGKSPLFSSILVGAVLQIVMVVLGTVIPTLGQAGNFYPVVGTAIAALVGSRFSRRSPGVPIGASLRGGALAGGVSSFIGAIAAAIAGAAAGAEIETVAIATVTGGVAGMVGGVFGRLLPPRSAES
ncbi:MAG TPA: hypothetical protein VGP87_03325 [Gemmatimonadales bacterium]|jgi:hypothetical protein|nr:hypothetical protein [Gemmatimonadales bacterium]